MFRWKLINRCQVSTVSRGDQMGGVGGGSTGKGGGVGETIQRITIDTFQQGYHSLLDLIQIIFF